MFGFFTAIIDLIATIIGGVFRLIASILGGCFGMAIVGIIALALIAFLLLHAL